MERPTCDTCDAQGVCGNRRPGRKACNQYERLPGCTTCRKREFCPDASMDQWCFNYQEEPNEK